MPITYLLHPCPICQTPNTNPEFCSRACAYESFRRRAAAQRLTMIGELWLRIEPEPNSGCWLFVGSQTSDGYGELKIARRPHYAHRLAYEAYRGPIPDGLEIDHLCRVRCCVNPWHLEVVTHLVNTLRSLAPMALNLSKQECPRGHEYDIVKRDGARGCRTCKNDLARARNISVAS